MSAGQQQIDVSAVVACVRAIAAYCNHKSGNYPVWTNANKDLAKRIIGCCWQPATRDWRLEVHWQEKVATAGLDPETFEIRDPDALKAALEGAVKSKLERKMRIQQKKFAQSIEVQDYQPPLAKNGEQLLYLP